MHEYLAFSRPFYRECINCKKRTPHTCLRCNYCYSCHPKIERIEKEIKIKARSHRKIRKPTFVISTADNR